MPCIINTEFTFHSRVVCINIILFCSGHELHDKNASLVVGGFSFFSLCCFLISGFLWFVGFFSQQLDKSLYIYIFEKVWLNVSV